MNGIDILNEFETIISDYAGSRYGVATDSCVHAIFLSLLYLKETGELHDGDIIVLPKQTFRSVPTYVKRAGFKITPYDIHWDGRYRLSPTQVYDSAVYFEKDMYIEDSFYCLSFQYRKALPIGRGGMILTDDESAVKRLKELRLNGKDGWNMYMTPEQAMRGISLFEQFQMKTCYKDYPDWTVSQ